MVEVGFWLQSVGLPQYEGTFRRNAIGVDVLPDLTDDNLREMGLPLGDRLKLLKAIAALRGERASLTGPAFSTSESAPLPGGERRQVTVLFADLSGYTVLSNELDPEEAHALLEGFFALADGVVREHGGSIDKHIGDCVMAVFGAPIAHRNDAERAVCAALAIRDAMPDLSAELGRPLGVHIGVAGGQVVASRTGSTNHREYTVTGETVNSAARLTDQAASGEILVSEKVWRAPGRLEGDEVESLAVKGFNTPVFAWRVLNLRSATTMARIPLAGRQLELQSFLELIEACQKTGQGGAIYLRGEAGIGKTRLVEEFRTAAGSSSFACHAGFVLDIGAMGGRDAITALMRSLLGAEDCNDLESAQAAATEALEQHLIEADQAVFLNDLLDLPQPTELRHLYDAMDHASRSIGKQHIFAQLVQQAARKQPRLLTVEDLHWASHPTLELLAEVTAAVAECPAILVMTSSTETEPLDEDWLGATRGARLIKMDLGPLCREEALALAAALADTPPALVARCVERAAGNPLFLTHLVYQAAESTEASVPSSVQSLVQEQIDRLAPEHKEALQACSVLGQRSEAGALTHLLGGYAPDFLTADRLVRRRGDAFWFAHALIRDAIYDSLLKSRRRAMHRRAADWYADRDPVLYAEHLDHADDPKASQAYLAAARSQAAEYRHEHALRLVERGLAIARKNADAFALAYLEGDLLRDSGSMPAAATAYQKALDATTDCAQRCRAWIGLASVKRVTDDLEGAFGDLDRAEREAAAQGGLLLAEQARIHFLRGNLFVPRGQIDQCLRQHGRSLELARQAGSPELEAAALGGLGDAEYARGRMISAHACFLRCIDLARQHGCDRIEVANRPMVAITQWYAGDTNGALREALLAIEAAVRIRHRRAELIAHHAAYFCRHAMGELQAAWDNVERALALAQQLNARRFEAGVLAFRAELKRLVGCRSEALVDVTDALRISREAGMDFLGPVILAILALVTDDPEVRNAALSEGDALLAMGSLSRNQLQFRRDAIDACLQAGDWGRAEAYAAELEDYARAEPMPWTNYIVARGRALAAHGAGRSDRALGIELLRLRDQGAGLYLGLTLPAIDAALEAMGFCSA